MYSRRAALAGLAGGAVVSLSGCALLGDEIEQSASPAAVSEQTLQETGYTEQRMDDQTFEQTVTVNDEDRDLRLTNWVTEYAKLPDSDERSVASFLIFTTPTVSVAGREANPFETFSEEQLIRRLLDQSEQMDADDLETEGERETEILGEAVDISTYRTTCLCSGPCVTWR
ncbi:MAG: DUF6517 family protein, partial [Halovenus sp.]